MTFSALFVLKVLPLLLTLLFSSISSIIYQLEFKFSFLISSFDVCFENNYKKINVLLFKDLKK
jgi:hypothetical protein